MFVIKKFFIIVLLVIFFVYGLLAVHHNMKILPKDITYAGGIHAAHSDEIAFLYDETYRDTQGNITSNQRIFDAVFAMIDQAQKYILIDMFLYNDYMSTDAVPYRDLTTALTQRLIEKKQQNPTIAIDVITDEINTMYGTRTPQHLVDLKEAGIHVIFTDLRPLRDSNPLYSAGWRLFAQWFGVGERGFLPHPFSGAEEKVSVRSYLTLLNFKANHRKVVMTDDGGDDYISLVTSANPHNGSSAHSNVALQVRGPIARDIYAAEHAVAQMSNASLTHIVFHERAFVRKEREEIYVQLLTERHIKKKIIAALAGTKQGDAVDIGMFYLSDRDIVKALQRAAQRSVRIRLVLDPNKDAFGHEKNGMPNRQVAHELISGDGSEHIDIRWYITHGEQFHTKILLITWSDDTSTLLTGSANYTKRNIDNYNLEANIWLRAPTEMPVMQSAHAYYDALWYNTNDRLFTADYEEYADATSWKTILYRFQEKTGFSTF